MSPRVIRRRRDGMVEIRPIRARDLVPRSDTMVLLGMLAGWFFFMVILVITLVFDPPLLALAAWGVLLLAVEDRRSSRQPRLAEVHVAPPPGAA